MESHHDFSPPQVDTSRPSMGFPLGTALILLIIFSLSGIFSCCYHWEKFRSLHQSLSDLEAARAHAHTQSPPSKSKPQFKEMERERKGQSLTVLMPGDDVPKFIAMPCPCQPLRPEEIIVRVEKPPRPP
ncbi:hydroxyproline-rich glycoprotein family protein [Trifolium repens]|nr:hydroxyproline-rich glycoprotein family protein [Trifolium repens]